MTKKNESDEVKPEVQPNTVPFVWWGRFSHAIAIELGMGPAAIYATVTNFMNMENGDGTCWASQEEIAYRSGIKSRKAAGKYLLELVINGYLNEVGVREDTGTTIYKQADLITKTSEAALVTEARRRDQKDVERTERLAHRRNRILEVGDSKKKKAGKKETSKGGMVLKDPGVGIKRPRGWASETQGLGLIDPQKELGKELAEELKNNESGVPPLLAENGEGDAPSPSGPPVFDRRDSLIGYAQSTGPQVKPGRKPKGEKVYPRLPADMGKVSLCEYRPMYQVAAKVYRTCSAQVFLSRYGCDPGEFFKPLARYLVDIPVPGELEELLGVRPAAWLAGQREADPPKATSTVTSAERLHVWRKFGNGDPVRGRLRWAWEIISGQAGEYAAAERAEFSRLLQGGETPEEYLKVHAAMCAGVHPSQRLVGDAPKVFTEIIGMEPLEYINSVKTAWPD